MPDARPLGNTASAIAEWINDQNLLDVHDYQRIILLAVEQNFEAIIRVAMDGASRNNREFQVGTYMVAGHFDRAQDKMIDIKLSETPRVAVVTDRAVGQ